MALERTQVAAALRGAGLHSIPVLQTGIGRDAVVRALDRCSAGLVILAGACGGLRRVSDVPPIARVVDEHGNAWTPWHADASGVTLAAVDRIISTPEDKRSLGAALDASIVDMESHAFAAACEGRALAWSVVRGVSDTPEETLPHEVLGWITPGGDTRAARAVLDMARRPRLIGHMAGVVRRSRRVLPLVGEHVADLIREWQLSGGAA